MICQVTLVMSGHTGGDIICQVTLLVMSGHTGDICQVTLVICQVTLVICQVTLVI